MAPRIVVDRSSARLCPDIGLSHAVAVPFIAASFSRVSWGGNGSVVGIIATLLTQLICDIAELRGTGLDFGRAPGDGTQAFYVVVCARRVFEDLFDAWFLTRSLVLASKLLSLLDSLTAPRSRGHGTNRAIGDVVDYNRARRSHNRRDVREQAGDY